MELQTQTKMTVDMLTADSVSILKQEMAQINGVWTQIGENSRCAYLNTEQGRQQLIEQVEEPYRSAVLAVWDTKQ